MSEPTNDQKRALRKIGYDAGLSGRPRSRTEHEYVVSWRRGQERRASLLRGERESG